MSYFKLIFTTSFKYIKTALMVPFFNFLVDHLCWSTVLLKCSMKHLLSPEFFEAPVILHVFWRTHCSLARLRNRLTMNRGIIKGCSVINFLQLSFKKLQKPQDNNDCARLTALWKSCSISMMCLYSTKALYKACFIVLYLIALFWLVILMNMTSFS